jgi:hypothetical protein
MGLPRQQFETINHVFYNGFLGGVFVLRISHSDKKIREKV